MDKQTLDNFIKELKDWSNAMYGKGETLQMSDMARILDDLVASLESAPQSDTKDTNENS